MCGNHTIVLTWLQLGGVPILFYRHHHHHHVVPLAWISLTVSRHFSLSFIASGRSSGLHPVSSHGCCMYVQAGRPAFAWPYVGVHRTTSFMSSSLLLQQCPASSLDSFRDGRLVAIELVLGLHSLMVQASRSWQTVGRLFCQIWLLMSSIVQWRAGLPKTNLVFVCFFI